jgi:hypothetical protein
MFNCRGYNVLSPAAQGVGASKQGEIVALRAAAGKYNFMRLRMDKCRNLFARLLQ